MTKNADFALKMNRAEFRKSRERSVHAQNIQS